MGETSYPVKSRSGSASVMTLIIIIILVIVGSFAMSAASYNTKLSAAATHWSKYYYRLDAEGEKFLFEVDKRLYQAEKRALSYVINREYNELTHKDLPVELQLKVRSNFDSEDTGESLNKTLNMVYFFYSDIYLKEMGEIYPNSIIYSPAEGGEVTLIIADIIFTATDNPDFHLSVSLEAKPLVYDFSLATDKYIYTPEGARRFVIRSWNQWQTTVVS